VLQHDPAIAVVVLEGLDLRRRLALADREDAVQPLLDLAEPGGLDGPEADASSLPGAQSEPLLDRHLGRRHREDRVRLWLLGAGAAQQYVEEAHTPSSSRVSRWS